MSSTQIAWGLVVALIGIIGTLLAAFIRRHSQTPSEDAQTDASRSQAWSTLTEAQGSWADRLERRVTALETDLRHEQEQRRLSNQYARDLAADLERAGMTVRPAPDGLDLN